MLGVHSYNPPSSPEQALAEAGSQLEYRHQTRDGTPSARFPARPGSYVELLELIESYLNGPRTLSNERLSYLIVSRTPAKLPTPPSTPRNSEVLPVCPPERLTDDKPIDHELFICAAHSIGDGMALHQFANDFFGLLGSASSQEEMEQLVADEWKQRWGRPLPADVRLSQSWYHAARLK